jgi:HTH-type transcriptional regulator/antitoxin HigA
MDIRPLRTEADYDWALAEIEQYFLEEPALGTPDSDRFDVLVTLIEAYEAIHWRIDPPDPVDMIREVMTMRNLSQVDLAELLGSGSQASEILGKQRRLTLDMVHRLAQEWGIPPETLIKPYPLEN